MINFVILTKRELFLLTLSNNGKFSNIILEFAMLKTMLISVNAYNKINRRKSIE